MTRQADLLADKLANDSITLPSPSTQVTIIDTSLLGRALASPTIGDQQ